jgi:hypothetical protein
MCPQRLQRKWDTLRPYWPLFCRTLQAVAVPREPIRLADGIRRGDRRRYLLDLESGVYRLRAALHYFGNSPRAMPGVFAGYRGGDRHRYDRAHAFPMTYRALLPYYEWVEHTLPVQTAAMGTKEEVFLRGAARAALHPQTAKDISRASYRP